jgi:glycosyltransferase involved in cell wall biosynthesis
VLLEAMACAKPVIASNVGGIPEAFNNGKHGLLIAPADVAALSDAMLKLGSSAQERSEMGLAARAHVERNFSRELYTQNMVALYRSILARRNSA